MEENNVVVAEAEQPQSNKTSFGEKVKEFFRKQIINLKRKPQNIGFLLVLVTCAFNLLVLGSYSKGLQNSGAASNIEWVGLMVFINTLFSLLSVVAYMNSFPKMRKPPKKKKGKDGKEYFKENKTVLTVHFTKATKININLIMGAVFIVFAIVMIVCELYYRSVMVPYATGMAAANDKTKEAQNLLLAANTYSLVHVILLAVDIVLFLLTPLTGKLLAKINTNKEVESAVSNMQEIDLASDE